MLERIRATASHLTSGEPAETPLPTFDELPAFHNFPGCAWEVWGKGDQLGTVNLLTDAVVKRAAQEEIRTGKAISLNWPLNFPEKPLFGRRAPHIESMHVHGTDVRDEEIHMNSQSGSQWDGIKHFPIAEHSVLYTGVPVRSLPVGHFPMPNPSSVDPDLIKLGIHNWAQHGICGRGVLLDLVRHFTKDGASLPYDPWTAHSVTVADLQGCARAQGVTFRRGDILLLRVGFIQKYMSVEQSAREELSARPETFAGIEQTDDMKRFLWNNHFAAIASDQPALERWPPVEDNYLHQTILGLWGMPIGEFFDIEALSAACAESGRYTFFFSSWPLNILGGTASPPNAAAYF
ncbi:hypothetical protein BV25DRAFT_1916420 [Artomyces pyxidatus]|uniref:Uncharacterized protein n=1 Tax=Artomyces pyxidatus TaxID=48021 RepID=A0ACB8T049_9AGAM|nr:hypothetical protein BV25DRAFT_1916420 [Artomyces pyxidatus]